MRIHGTTKRQVLHVFAKEKPSLRPLPDSLFPSFEEAQRCVHRDGYVEVERAYYEAALEYNHPLIRPLDEYGSLIKTHCST